MNPTDRAPPSPWTSALPSQASHAAPRFLAAVIVVLLVQLGILYVALPYTAPPGPPELPYSVNWLMEGCEPNATYSVPLSYHLMFTNLDGPDAYAIMGFYVNSRLRSVFEVFVPKGSAPMEFEGSYSVSCENFSTASFRLADVVVA